jgi:hypothetical protein
MRVSSSRDTLSSVTGCHVRAFALVNQSQLKFFVAPVVPNRALSRDPFSVSAILYQRLVSAVTTH